MFKLLKINNIELPDPDGGFSVSKMDKFNEYEGEDGSVTIEAIRTGMTDVKVTYTGQNANALATIANALSLVSTVVFFDPSINDVKTITAKISGISFGKVHHRHNVSVWSLSFNVTEI